jgi:DNA-binding NarL/FixJ family response regulator
VVTIRVLLVDDDALVRAGLRIILSSAEDLEVVGEADDGARAVAAVRACRPDVVLMDIRMAETDGITATAAVRRLDPAPQVIVLTTFQADEQVLSALRAGAAGFLVKDIEPDDLLHSVRVAARGDALLAPSITRMLISRYVAQPLNPGAGTALKELTNREREAVALAAHGLSNDEIADRMVISPVTAKTHLNRAMVKLQARDRAQLVVLAYESGLVTPRTP